MSTTATEKPARRKGSTGPTKPAEPAAVPAEPALCGHDVNTAKGIKPCVKPLKADGSAHDGGHASRLQIRKEYAEIPLDTLTVEAVPSTEEIEYGGGRGEAERKADQKKIDEDVKTNYQNWVSHGKHKLSFNDAIAAGLASRYFVPPELEDAIRAKLRSAARFNGVGVRVAPKLKKHESGRYMLYWTAQDVQQHAPRTPATPATPEAVSGDESAA